MRLGLLGLLVPGVVQAQASCLEIQGSPDNCVPILACMAGDGVYISGHAIGWNEGTIGGTTNTGVSCLGTWTSRGILGTGMVQFQCEDGVSGTVIFYYQDSLTGTTTGRGLTSDMGRVTGWSGHHLRDYFDAETGEIDATPFCGDVPILMS